MDINIQYLDLGKKLKKERDKAYARVRERAENPPKGTKEYASLEMRKAQAKAHMSEIRKAAGIESPKGVEPDTQERERGPP